MEHILMKNALDALIGAVAWFVIGFPLAYGYTSTIKHSTDTGGDCYESVLKHGNEFAGGSFFGLANAFSYCGDPTDPLGLKNSSYKNALDGVELGKKPDFSKHDEEHCIKAPVPTMDDPNIFATWFFQWAFCVTGATIISGGVAERCVLGSYCIVALVMTMFVYPVIVAWTWSGNGWTAQGSGAHYFDFAGSGIVHMTGGIGALIGAVFCGPRPGRFEKPEDFVPGNMPFMYLRGW